MQGARDPIVQGDQAHNLELWRSVFGDGLKFLIHDFVGGATAVPEGTQQPWPCEPPSLWKDHLIGLEPAAGLPEEVLAEVVAVVFGECG